MDEESKAFAEWVDTTNLADVVMNGLAHYGLKQSAENAKKVWLDVLGTDFIEDVACSIEAFKDKNELGLTACQML